MVSLALNALSTHLRIIANRTIGGWIFYLQVVTQMERSDHGKSRRPQRNFVATVVLHCHDHLPIRLLDRYSFCRHLYIRLHRER